MIETKELQPLKAQISKLENQASAVQIETQEGYVEAIDLVANLKKIGSILKDKKESITKPLNESLRNARELFAPIEKRFQLAESTIKGKLLNYKRKTDEEARKKEEGIAKKIETGQIKKIETAEKKIEAIERVENTTHGQIGKIQIKKIKKVRIVDESKLPREYLVPDMVKIRKDALNGQLVLGVEVYEEEQVASSY